MTLQDIITGLNNAERFGGEIDSPEGTRYIIMSDTLAKLIAESLLKELFDGDSRD